MRKGRYKKNLMTENECPGFAKSFRPILTVLMQKWSRQEMTSVEFVAEYLLASLQILKPDSWKGARIRQGEPSNALETFEIYSFRGIPLSAQKTLMSWRDGNYQLKLFFHIPSTEEVLAMQSEGIRCVTCLIQDEELSKYVLNERDPVSFTLHDLIHADHFLRSPEQKRVQIGFSRWLHELWSQTELQIELQDPSFAQQFEYACADMNSHGAHLTKYLKAIFCQKNKSDLLLRLAQRTNVTDAFRSSLEALNTPLESMDHLIHLQEELFLKGSASRQNQKNDSVIFRELDSP